uniref:Uncharacterized protein n=1 Tax=Arion vulgaris TaxID=1028688 RepID=A0A0B7AZH6_9EUPU
MAPASLRSMYKVKAKEENTISSRRISRGLERKQNREDEVNKRRLIAEDMSWMSPVSEDNDAKYDRPLRNHQKAPTQLERLKQWREERKRTVNENKKPLFRVSTLTRTESSLYTGVGKKEIEPITESVRTVPTKQTASSNKSRSVKDVKPQSVAKAVSSQVNTKKKDGGTSSSGCNKVNQPLNSRETRKTAISTRPSFVSNRPLPQIRL